MNPYPPGPTDWCLGLSIVGRFRRDPLNYSLELGRHHGPIIHASVLGRHFYLMHRPDTIHQVLVTQARSFTKVEPIKRALRQVDGNGLINSEGDFWLRQRRLMQPAFHPGRLAGYAAAMVAATQRLLGEWGQCQELDIANAMTDLTVDIVGRTLFGVELLGQQAQQLREAVRAVSESLTHELNSAFPLPDWLPLPRQRRKRAALKFLDGFIRDLIRQRRAAGEDRGDLLSMLLLAVDEEGDGSGMTDEQARDEAMTLFNAGHDSTAAGLAWIWYLVAKHPEVQARLAAEAAEVLADQPATLAHLPRLTYLEQVVKEALRLYPPTWALITRAAINPVEVGGYVLPKGSWVSIFPWAVQRDPNLYPEPERFLPERFAPGGPATLLPPCAYIPFSAGPHICIGQSFAMMEMLLIVATTLQQYRVELAPGQGEAELEPLVALRPKGGVRVKIQRRHTATVNATVGSGERRV